MNSESPEPEGPYVDGDVGRFRIIRRDFLKAAAGASGMWVVFRALPRTAIASPPTSDFSSGWSGPPGKARYRIDGYAKVTGQKIYARDFRSRDMKGWPTAERSAYVLRSSVAGRKLESINLSILPPDLQPIRVITAAELDRDQIIFPGSDETANGKTKGLFVPVGEAPDFLGQPVAVLIFKNVRIFRQAHRLLQFNDEVLRYGEAVLQQNLAQPEEISTAVPRVAYKAHHLPHSRRVTRPYPRRMLAVPLTGPLYIPPTYLTRYADSSGEKFSQVLNGITDPYSTETGEDKEAAKWRQVITEELRTQGWKLFKDTYETQELDPLFMEPESGLGWLDPASSTLHLVIGTQSPDQSIVDAVDMFSDPKCPIKVKTIQVNSCYPGGGFGGRDISTFPTLLSIAAAYSDGPTRLAYDRFEQFQSGLKQLGASMTQTLAIDQDGRFQALVGDYQLRAGGRNNYSQWVAQLAGYCGGGGYAVPRVAIDAMAQSSVGVIAGSMRGFGGPQAAFALESLIDEAAKALNADPIVLRERNALAQGGYTVTGYQVRQSLRLAEICRLAREHPLWVEREQTKKQHSGTDILYGVGFALANLAYGTGRDGVMAAVEIDAGGKLRVTTNAVDMGNGSATSLAISTAKWLGANADDIRMGDPSPFAALNLSEAPSTKPWDWSNPRWTPALYMSSSASMTGCQQVHVVEEASRALLETGIWPLARKLWKFPKDRPFDPRFVAWKDGALVAPGETPLSLRQLARQLHQNRAVAAAMVHAVNQGRWVRASYDVGAENWRGAVDGLATRRAGSVAWTAHDRKNVETPPPNSENYGRSLFAPSGTLAAVEVNRASGEVKVVAVQSFLEAGRVIQPDMVMGQYYGGVAMGIGFALLEYLPHTVGGAGEGDWNLNRYRAALWRDLPLDRIELHLLEPVSPDEPGRGIAEAALTPIAPAIANAVADATGHRFHQLPITPDKVLEALRQ